MAKSTCRACGEIFKSVSGFDKHRIGEYEKPIYEQRTDGKKPRIIGRTPHTLRRMTVQEMLDIGMSKNDKGWWIMSAYQDSAHADDEEVEGETVEIPQPETAQTSPNGC